MGYVGTIDYSSYKKMWVLDQWCYFAHVMIMCLSTRKAGKDAMGHVLAAPMVGLSLNKGYNFSKYICKSMTDQINAVERWCSADYEPDLSEHSNEQVEEEEVGDEGSESAESSDGGDEEGGDGD
ncbi:hypothetical protein L1987_65045 [Smallanthus sonchifolius]|uniref:Uncharacterized protein n=1 Tax=Smallanthus sonchifolius TaxID=185202 RepID=A0ACB9BTD3_9ASTR|nr:hypothetical protein L1987_65045 [Smallanthus sonchifolius]